MWQDSLHILQFSKSSFPILPSNAKWYFMCVNYLWSGIRCPWSSSGSKRHCLWQREGKEISGLFPTMLSDRVGNKIEIPLGHLIVPMYLWGQLRLLLQVAYGGKMSCISVHILPLYLSSSHSLDWKGKRGGDLKRKCGGVESGKREHLLQTQR